MIGRLARAGVVLLVLGFFGSALGAVVWPWAGAVLVVYAVGVTAIVVGLLLFLACEWIWNGGPR